jgi:hypothetical protein
MHGRQAQVGPFSDILGREKRLKDALLDFG